MEILNTIKFVKGAVASTSSSLEMKHYAIENGNIRATNGVMSLGCPIDLDIACAPKASTFYKAITNCKEVVSMNLTPANRLSIRSGKFRALIPCVELSTVPHPKPSGRPMELHNDVLEAFETLQRFVCTDDIRPWTNGICLKGKSAFATNNVCLVEYWIGHDVPFDVNIPLPAVREVVRLGEKPASVLVDASSITFMYGDGRWIKSLLYDTDWPDLSRILDVQCNPQLIPGDLYDALKAVKPFSQEGENLVSFTDGSVTVQDASYEVPGLPPQGRYNPDMLGLMQGVATSADFTRYPDPVVFYGPRVRGAVMAYRE